MDFLFVIIILIMSVVIHEVAHGYAALALGDPTAKYQNRLTLNPISHLDLVGSIIVPLIGYFAGGFIVGWAKPVPYNPYNLRNQKWGEALVAVAGPLSNISLAVIFSLIIRFSHSLHILEQAVELLVFVIFINITLAIFNLIPIPPLDGSKILFAILPYKFQSVRAFLEQYGLIIVFVFIFFFWHFLNPVIGNILNFLIN